MYPDEYAARLRFLAVDDVAGQPHNEPPEATSDGARRLGVLQALVDMGFGERDAAEVGGGQVVAETPGQREREEEEEWEGACHGLGVTR